MLYPNELISQKLNNFILKPVNISSKMKINKKIILASASETRKNILKSLNFDFSVIKADINESEFDNISPQKRPELLAIKKAQKIHSILTREEKHNTLIIGADTLVILGKKVLGKPKNKEEAINFLRLLSGKKHNVISGLCVLDCDKNNYFSITNKNTVHFARLSTKEIEWYISTNEWQNAAGAYRIQENASLFIKKLQGSYSSVAGLPIFDFYDILRGHNFLL